MSRPVALVVEVTGRGYAPLRVTLNGRLIGFRPYDGKDHEEVEEEVLDALSGLLRERLGYSETQEEDD